MNHIEKLNVIAHSKLIGIIRSHTSKNLVDAARAIFDGGMRAIEITLNTPDVLDLISQTKHALGEDAIVGVGTVLDSESAYAAISSGADFIVTPTMSLEVIKLCNRHGIPTVIGCFSASECLAAAEAGADFIKLFPASVGGTGLLKAILAPLPQLRIVAVGGITLTNANSFLDSGAVGLGLGSSLFDEQQVSNGEFDALRARADAYVSLINSRQ